jgi:hypothetical protein
MCDFGVLYSACPKDIWAFNGGRKLVGMHLADERVVSISSSQQCRYLRVVGRWEIDLGQACIIACNAVILEEIHGLAVMVVDDDLLDKAATSHSTNGDVPKQERQRAFIRFQFIKFPVMRPSPVAYPLSSWSTASSA